MCDGSNKFTHPTSIFFTKREMKMIIPRVKSEKIFDGEYCLPEKIRIYTADYPAEKALNALRMFLPTVIFYEANTRAEADFILIRIYL